MMKVFLDPKWVARTPIASVALLEMANVQQLWRMWTEWSSAGQSLWGWLFVNIALWLWLNFYRVLTPDAKWAIRGTMLGIALNAAVLVSVALLRYVL